MANDETTTPESIDSVPICRTCGSEHVARDAWACFNRNSGLWELENVFDDAHCYSCEASTRLDWIPADALHNRRIRELNDQLRCHGKGNGTVVITQGLNALGKAALAEVAKAVQTFDNFSDDNDPWGEHDFGSIDVAEHKVFFKIDYYDPSMRHGSENPANEALTHRVMTLMLACEY